MQRPGTCRTQLSSSSPKAGRAQLVDAVLAGVSSQEFQSPRFFAGVDLSAALLCRDRIENSRTLREQGLV